MTTDIHSEDTGLTFNGSLEKKFEKSRVNMTVNRSLDPSGSGGQVERDSFEFRLNRPLTSRFQFYLNAYTFKSRTVEGNISNDDIRYYHIEPGTLWQLSREWNLNVAYRYINLKREYESKAATANFIYLTVAYYPLKMSISR